MSDPVSNADIEDVLSSIRRLVAGDKPEDTGAAATQSETRVDEVPSPPEQGEEALVLTPSLRVEDAETLDAGDSTQDPEADLWEKDGEMDRSPLADDISDLKMEPEAAPAPAEELAFSPISAEEPGDVSGDPDETELELPTFIRPLKGSVDPEPPSSDPEEPIESELAEAGHSIERGSEEEGEPARPAPRAGFMFSPLSDDDLDSPADEIEEAPYLEATEDFEEAFEPEDETPETRIVLEQPASAQEEAEPEDTAEEAVAEPPEAHLHFTKESVDSVDEEDPWSADLDGGASAGSEDTPDPAFEAPANLFATEAASLDEEALREMVTEMLHKELRGALGERITRNVRKLVRREIHRALASRDFD